MDNIQADFEFEGYKIDNISFKLNPNFKGGAIGINLKFNIVPGISDDFKKGSLSITADINHTNDSSESNALFSASVTMVGLFNNPSNASKEDFGRFLHLNGVATLMPFLRGAIADITRTANIPPCVIPLINVYKMTDTPLAEK